MRMLGPLVLRRGTLKKKHAIESHVYVIQSAVPPSSHRVKNDNTCNSLKMPALLRLRAQEKPWQAQLASGNIGNKVKVSLPVP